MPEAPTANSKSQPKSFLATSWDPKLPWGNPTPQSKPECAPVLRLPDGVGTDWTPPRPRLYFRSFFPCPSEAVAGCPDRTTDRLRWEGSRLPAAEAVDDSRSAIARPAAANPAESATAAAARAERRHGAWAGRSATRSSRGAVRTERTLLCRTRRARSLEIGTVRFRATCRRRRRSGQT